MHMHDVAIHPARREDLASLGEIEDAAESMFDLADLPAALRGHLRPIQEFENARRCQSLWVATDPTAGPVAFLMAGVLDSCLHVVELDVHPAFGRRGIGGRLLGHALQRARDRCFPAVVLTTFEHLPWNARFYARRGFTVISPPDCGPELEAVLARERIAGFERRVAMRWKPHIVAQ